MTSQFRPGLFAGVLALAFTPTLAWSADEGRYQLEVGPPVVVLDTETGEVWIGVSHPTETLVLRRGRYQDEDGEYHSFPPDD
ncbi:hypothetical protein [Aquisalimonas sp.]|uniref:hypothetical protein n=1 Tax=Aquisalimonas sp. TaxID=1872621 RepID=UPI0025C17821|nr:hypothetical protein [Aquisalimonas sp.]